MSEPVIAVSGLRKRRGDNEAMRGVDLEVRAGEVFAFLGPNGAGKTTTVAGPDAPEPLTVGTRGSA